MITFHSIKFKNLLSYGNTFTKIDLDKHQTTCFLGRNGSGKCVCADSRIRIRERGSELDVYTSVQRLYEEYKTGEPFEIIDEKFIDSVPLHNLEIETDTGWWPITYVHKTVPFQVWKIETEHFWLRCADIHILFDENMNEVFVEDLLPWKSRIQTIYGVQTVRGVHKFDQVENMYDLSVESSYHRFYTDGILSHNSSVNSAICYALFGRAFRPIKKDQLINQKNRKDLVCEINFSVNNKKYTVRRGMNPGLFEIYRGKELINQNSSIRDYQTFFEQTILGFDFNTFSQIVMLSKVNYTSFMQLKAGPRRQFVENVLGVGIFSSMFDVHKSNVSQLKEEFQDVKNQQSVLKRIIEHRQQHISNLQQDSALQHNERVEAHKRLISKLHLEIEEEGVKLREIQDKLTPLDPTALPVARKRLIDLGKLQGKIESQFKAIQTEINFFEQNEVCPSCQQSICEDKKHSRLRELQEKKKTFEKALTELLEKEAETEQKIKELQQISSDNNSLQSEITLVVASIEDKTRRVTVLESEEIKPPELNRIEQERALLQEDRDKIGVLDSTRDTLSEREFMYDAVSQMLKDSGIKRTIVQQFIPMINSIINKYLVELGFHYKFTLDEDFQEEIYTVSKSKLSYYNFSEGEKARIDVALLMAWREIASIRSNLNTNLLILDEVIFHGSLETSANSVFFEMLSKLENQNVIVISHTLGDLEQEFDRRCSFKKPNGFSKVEITEQ